MADMTLPARTLSLSDSAVRRVRQLQKHQGDEGLMLRVTVSGGGCAGFQYSFGFDSDATAEDLTFEKDGVQVVVDDVSLDLLAGSEIHYEEELIGAYFVVRNPNATSSCGCGTSFSV